MQHLISKRYRDEDVDHKTTTENLLHRRTNGIDVGCWQKDESLNAIARLFDRHHSSIQHILAETGGIRPAPRRRSQLVLSLAEREEISRGLAGCLSLRTIATQLGRAPSTISREENRNGEQHGYCTSQAV